MDEVVQTENTKNPQTENTQKTHVVDDVVACMSSQIEAVIAERLDDGLRSLAESLAVANASMELQRQTNLELLERLERMEKRQANEHE